jgi:hypothetical protein
LTGSASHSNTDGGFHNAPDTGVFSSHDNPGLAGGGGISFFLIKTAIWIDGAQASRLLGWASRATLALKDIRSGPGKSRVSEIGDPDDLFQRVAIPAPAGKVPVLQQNPDFTPPSANPPMVVKIFAIKMSPFVPWNAICQPHFNFVLTKFSGGVEVILG